MVHCPHSSLLLYDLMKVVCSTQTTYLISCLALQISLREIIIAPLRLRHPNGVYFSLHPWGHSRIMAITPFTFILFIKKLEYKKKMEGKSNQIQAIQSLQMRMRIMPECAGEKESTELKLKAEESITTNI